MDRKARDHRLETRNARERLRQSRRPYWRTISIGCHIGYYRGSRGGTWIARCRQKGAKGYFQKSLGEADDLREANGVTILSFSQAQARARDWFDEVFKARHGRPDRYTVGDALDDYLERFTGKSLEKTRHTIERHIRPVLGNCPVCELTTAELTRFQCELATRRSVYRANRKGEAKPRPDDGDSARRGKANSNRIFTPLKAALNRAFNEGKVPDDTAWRRVKPFRKVSVARIRYFTRAEVDALLTAAEPWFRAVIQGALFTGARWSEIFQMKVRDVDLRSGTLLFPETKGGRPRYVHLTDDGIRFFARHCAGKQLNDPVFVNQHGRCLGPSHQIRPMKMTCLKAGVDAAGFHILRHTYGSTLAMAGVPLAVIADALGHADERITRKHYAHLSPSYVRDAVRAGLGSLGSFDFPALRLIEAGA
ncbi:MAG TPA: tyrosine-type recombinase/integrase [Sphingomicrobium sp.]|nr:tyrosine-type recombinase/integrase [Sphingomicrobium sp.]